MSQREMDGSCDADSIVIDCSDDEYSPLDTDTPQSSIEVANRETVEYVYHDGQVDNFTENKLACDRGTVCQLPFVSSLAQSETSQVEPTTCQSADTGSTGEAHTARAGFTVSQSSVSSMDSAATRYATALLREEPSVNTAEPCASESLGSAAMPGLPSEQAQTGSLSEPRIVDVRSLREESEDLTEWGETHRAVHDKEGLSDADQLSTSNQHAIFHHEVPDMHTENIGQRNGFASESDVPHTAMHDEERQDGPSDANQLSTSNLLATVHHEVLDMHTDNIGQSDGFASHLSRVTPPIGEDVLSEHNISTVIVSTEEGHCLQTQAAIIKSERSVSGSDQHAPDFREGSWFWLEMAGRQYDTTASQDTDNEQFPYFPNSHDCEESPLETCQDMPHPAGSSQHESPSEECAPDIRHGIPNFLDVPFAADTEGVTLSDSQSHRNSALENQLRERTISGSERILSENQPYQSTLSEGQPQDRNSESHQHERSISDSDPRQKNISNSSESQQHEIIVCESPPNESHNAENHSHDMSSESQPNESTNAEIHQSETNTTESCPHEADSNISDSCPSETAVVESPLLKTTAPENQSLQTTAPERHPRQTTAPERHHRQTTARENQSLQTTASASQSNRKAASDDSLQENGTSFTARLSSRQSRQRKRTHGQMCHSGRTGGEEVPLTEETSVASADVLLNPDISEPSSSTVSALGDESSALPHKTPPRETPGHAAKGSTRILRSRRKLASSSKQVKGSGLKQNHSDQAAGEGSGDDQWWGTTAELPGDIVNVPGDGHCIIHAAVHASCEAGNQITHDELCNELMCEILCFRDHYQNFTTDGQDIIRELSMFIFDNHYDTDTCDLLLGALPNVLESNVDVYHFQDDYRKYQRIKFRPQRQSVQPQRTIVLIRRGDHYSALDPFSSRPQKQHKN